MRPGSPDHPGGAYDPMYRLWLLHSAVSRNIPIPEYFALFQHGYMTTQMVYYYNLTQTHPKAGDCIGCRQCEKHCPQHIEITRNLKEISEKFDGFKGWR